jgi:hypothetical protein
MKYEHILWNKEEGHDKIWGIIQLGEVEHQKFHWGTEYKYATFWGRRGKSLQTKVWAGMDWEAKDQRDKKLKKGYRAIDPIKMEEVYPELEDDLEKTAVWAILRS